MKNTGIEFEMLVQSIFQEINNQESAKNIVVEQNIQIPGKSGVRHQIDVYWEFEIGGVIYKTIVQAKDWNSSVKQEQVLVFKSVLDDIPSQPRGFIVIKKTFQKGAKIYANSHGIELFKLEEIPKPEPLRMTVGGFAHFFANLKEGCFEITNYPVKFKGNNILINEKWLREERIDLETLSKKQTGMNLWSWKLFDSSFNEIGTFGTVMMEKKDSITSDAETFLKKENIYLKKFIHKFENPTYYEAELESKQFLRIERIDFTVEITRDPLIKREFIVPGVTKFVLKNVQSGTEKKFIVTEKVEAV